MKNILFITPSLGYGGVAKMLTFLSNSLVDRNYKVCIANLQATTKEVNQAIQSEIRVVNIETSGRKGVKRFEQIKKIKRLAKEIQADIIIGFTFFPNMIATIVARKLHIPSIISERGDPYITIGKSFVDRILLNIINKSQGAVFQTEGARGFYKKGLQKRGKVIANPIFVKGDLHIVRQSERAKTVVSVGRLSNDQKRYDIMIKAFSLFHKKHPEYCLKLYGSGPDQEKIAEWVCENDVGENVLFLGVSKQPMQDIQCEGIFLITSDFEGISNALLEAMGTGLPCVSTDSSPGGARMLISHKENGLLVPVGDCEAIADALCLYAENPNLAESCGNKAKEVLTRFAPDVIIGQWEDYINGLIEKRNEKVD